MSTSLTLTRSAALHRGHASTDGINDLIAQEHERCADGKQSSLGSLRSARLLMYSVDFGPIERAQHLGRWDLATEILRDAARSLQAGGAQCIVLCTNTRHRVAAEIQDVADIPMIHIADPVGRAAGATATGRLGSSGRNSRWSKPS